MAIEEDKQAYEQGFINRKAVKQSNKKKEADDDLDLEVGSAFYDVKRTSSCNKRLVIVSSSSKKKKKENKEEEEEEDSIIQNIVVWVSDEDTESGMLNPLHALMQNQKQ